MFVSQELVTIISLPTMLLMTYVGEEILPSYFSKRVNNSAQKRKNHACPLIHHVASIVRLLFVQYVDATLLVQTCLAKHSHCDLTLSLDSSSSFATVR